jgi:hypothetical protein
MVAYVTVVTISVSSVVVLVLSDAVEQDTVRRPADAVFVIVESYAGTVLESVTMVEREAEDTDATF